MDWIQGDKFKELGKWRYAPSWKHNDNYDGLTNTFEIDKVMDGDIIYTHTFYVKLLFEWLQGNDFHIKDKKIIVITHNSDTNINDSFIIPDCVDRWFAQNVNTRKFKITSIPIGLENDRWFSGLCKKEKMLLKLGEFKKYKNLVYINHNVATNPAKRLKPYEVLANKPWVNSERRANGDRFDEYLDDIYNHKFVVCPEGNGIDTHRIWECLYMRTIPIVEDNINNETYKLVFPMVAIKDWEEVTEERLAQETIRINGTIWDWNILTFEYWKNKIKNK